MGKVGGRSSPLGDKQRSLNMGKLLSGITAVVVGLGLSLAIVGCTGSTSTPAKDKMSSDKMGGDKMKDDKMKDDKMSGDKMKDDKMKDDKMKDDKMKDDKKDK
jgi:pentapeptide MXKDX repeat protein